MLDLLPFPRFSSSSAEKQVAELTSYLIQFKEDLEFILRNISEENLSADLLAKLESGGGGVQLGGMKEDELAQVAGKSLTVSDVCNSGIFKSAVKSEVSSITFSINFSTGYLEYDTK